MRKFGVLAAIILLAGMFVAFGVHDALGFNAIKAREAELVALFRERPVTVIAAFMAVQVTALALAFPGAVLTLSLIGGAIFGPWLGAVIALVAITVGDSAGFLLARYLGRDLVRRHASIRLRAMILEADNGGPYYLLSLRLMALAPYFMVNWGFAMTQMPVRRFAPLSLLGLAPSVFLYAQAGTALGQLRTASDIYSLRLVLCFILLGIVPLIARLLFARNRTRTASAPAKAVQRGP